MIVLDFKTDTASPLNLSASKEKPKISFADLLKNLNTKVKASDIAPLALASNAQEKSEVVVKNIKNIPKSEALAALLRGSEKIATDSKEDLLLLNPKLLGAFSKDDMKSLIFDAKKYLKTKIEDSDGFKKLEIKELPKTLKGLTEIAQKLGIDISKISIEDVKSSAKAGSLSGAELKESTQMHTPQDKDKQNIFDKIILKSQEEPLKEIKTIPIAKAEAAIPAVKAEAAIPAVKVEPVFERVVTEQLVNLKAIGAPQLEHKTPKDRSDEALKSLLKGEKPLQSDVAINTDLSVAAAKVLAPKTKEDEVSSLERLLQGNNPVSNNPTTQTKSDAGSSVDGVTPLKSDSLELKLNEAKQMIRYLSDDIKNAIDDYRSPFTRVRVQLNPQNLGEMDLTIIQRGKNLHVNLSSNNSAINTLALNINELKVQLSNSGINSATINFSNGADAGANSANGFNDRQQQQQQQQQQNGQKAQEEYSYFANDGLGEEVLSSLEIVVPRYI